MATIVKRGKKYSVVYYYTDENGEQQQKWEPPVSSKKEAQRRKNEIEHELDTGTFIPPARVKVGEFLNDFVEMYGTKRWGLSVYASNTALIENYINPLLADHLVQEVNTRIVDWFIHQLQKTKPVSTPYRHAKTDYITPCTIEKIVKLMRTAFKQAVHGEWLVKIRLMVQSFPKGKRRHEQSGMQLPSVRRWMSAMMGNCMLL